MPNLHKDVFLSLLEQKKKENYIFFNEKEEIIENKKFKYLECNIDLDILKVAVNLAKEKSQFTMSQNQAAIPRDKVTKLQKCAQGVLAEMFIHILLMERYGFEVLRYDLERNSFVYKTDEYDLNIYISDQVYEVESRSSNIHHLSIKNFVENDVIIGPYGNSVKQADELADFHFRPIYMPNFEPFSYKDGKYVYNKKLVDGTIKLIITGVATRQDFIRHAYKGTLGQRGTTYLLVPAKMAGDIDEMDKKFKSIMS